MSSYIFPHGATFEINLLGVVNETVGPGTGTDDITNGFFSVFSRE